MMRLTDWLWELSQIEIGLAELPGDLYIDILFALRVKGVVDGGQSYRTFPFKGYINTSLPVVLKCTQVDGEALWVDLGHQSPHVFRMDLRTYNIEARSSLAEGIHFDDLGWHVVYYCNRCDRSVLQNNGRVRVAIDNLDHGIRRLFRDPPPGVPNDIRDVCLHCGWTTAILWLALSNRHPLLYAWGNSGIARNLWGLYDYFIELSHDFCVSTRSALSYLRHVAQNESMAIGGNIGIERPALLSHLQAAKRLIGSFTKEGRVNIDATEAELVYAENATIEYLETRFGEQDDATGNWPTDWHECPEAWELCKKKIMEFRASEAIVHLTAAEQSAAMEPSAPEQSHTIVAFYREALSIRDALSQAVGNGETSESTGHPQTLAELVSRFDSAGLQGKMDTALAAADKTGDSRIIGGLLHNLGVALLELPKAIEAGKTKLGDYKAVKYSKEWRRADMACHSAFRALDPYIFSLRKQSAIPGKPDGVDAEQGQQFKWAKQTEIIRAVCQVLGPGELDKGVLSRAVQNCEIKGNRLPGRASRVDVESFLIWIARRKKLQHDETLQIRNAIAAEIDSRKASRN